MRTVLLVGAYGQGNLGDDALLDAFVAELPGWRVAATTLDPAATGAARCDAVRRRPWPVLRQAARSDAVVFGGGTVFKPLHPLTGRRPLALLRSSSALVALASLLNRPVALLGVGAAHLDTAVEARIARRIARRSRLLVVRDEESARELVAAGVPGPLRVSADPAWVLLDPPVASATGQGNRVLVIPSRLSAPKDGGGLERSADTLASALSRLVHEGVHVQLQSWERPHTDFSRSVEEAPRDDALVELLAELLGPEVERLPTPPSLGDAVVSMRDASAVLTYRFHGLVAAGAAGVPAVAVEHEPKLAGLARRLGQSTVPADAGERDLRAAVIAAMGSNGPDPGAVKQEIVRAEEGFRLLRVLLAAGETDESDELGALPLSEWN